MEEKSLLFISIAISFIGLLLLAGYFFSLQPMKISLRDFKKENIGKLVIFSFKPFEAKFNEKSAVVYFDNTKENYALLNNPSNQERLILFEGHAITVTGFLKEFDGKVYLQIDGMQND